VKAKGKAEHCSTFDGSVSKQAIVFDRWEVGSLSLFPMQVWPRRFNLLSRVLQSPLLHSSPMQVYHFSGYSELCEAFFYQMQGDPHCLNPVDRRNHWHHLHCPDTKNEAQTDRGFVDQSYRDAEY
jgi:hypothetical protein